VESALADIYRSSVSIDQTASHNFVFKLFLQHVFQTILRVYRNFSLSVCALLVWWKRGKVLLVKPKNSVG